MLFALLLSALSFGADAQEIWNLPYPGEKPVAAFFDAASGAIFVSVKEGERPRLDRVSLDGKLDRKAVATAKGEPGNLRAFDGKIYWIAGDGVQIVDPKGSRGSLAHVPQSKARPSEIAIARDGAVYLAFDNGALYRITEKKAELAKELKAIRGMVLLENQLHILVEKELVTLSLEKNLAKKESFCDCTGLERSSRGTWLTAQGGRVLEGKKALLTLKKELGRPAYVYRMDPSQDFFVLPFPSEGMLRAYRMPGVGKSK